MDPIVPSVFQIQTGTNPPALLLFNKHGNANDEFLPSFPSKIPIGHATSPSTPSNLGGENS